MKDKHILLSNLDSRFSDDLDYLSQYFSYAAILRYKLLLIVEWGILGADLKSPELRDLRMVYEKFDAKESKVLDKMGTGVKGILKYLETKIEDKSLYSVFKKTLTECSDFGLERLAYTCMVRDFVDREIDSLMTSNINVLHSQASAFAAQAFEMGAKKVSTYGFEMIKYVAAFEFVVKKLLDDTPMLVGPVSALGELMNGALMEKNKEFVTNLGLEYDFYADDAVVTVCIIGILDLMRQILSIQEGSLNFLMINADIDKNKILEVKAHTVSSYSMLSGSRNNHMLIAEAFSYFVLSVREYMAFVYGLDLQSTLKKSDKVTKLTESLSQFVFNYELKVSGGSCGSSGGCEGCHGCG